MNMHNAIKQSCDVYFYTLGQRLGVDRIHKYASMFGLNSRTGLELVQEDPGLIPSTKWKAKRYKGTEQERWWPGETLSVAIGQGATTVTPLQMAVAIAAVVNGGKILKPRLVREITSSDRQFVDDDFNSLPGFKTHPWYKDFSQPYFDNKHSLLLGGSWATTGTAASKYYRLWFRDYFYQHAGFHLAKSID